MHLNRTATSRFVGASRNGDKGPLVGLCGSFLEGRDAGCDLVITAHTTDQELSDAGVVYVFTGTLRRPVRSPCWVSRGVLCGMWISHVWHVG